MKNKQEAYEKHVEMSRILIIKQKKYQIFHIIKTIINSLIYQDEQVKAFLNKLFRRKIRRRSWCNDVLLMPKSHKNVF